MTALLGDGWVPPLVAAIVAVLVAVAGAVATTTDAWYGGLRKPAWKPPDWAFGPVWTVIFALTATAGVLAWNGDPSPVARGALIAAYGVNIVLNIAWSVIFFRMRRPDLALVEVVLLWLSILALVLVTGRVTLVAALLNLPYLGWVSVATFLNLRIVQLNPRLREA
ncbi:MULTISPECIES: TspO/MBR family protein [Methylobacterium]|uniref:Tryptophan-rich protein TspO n=1 Tax=Methylobacterium thuringiense TaxID=1003091 RepID=A0ABQ4TIA8_9HYPH|nr:MULTISPECIES: TspO/MBR family protein [Methylobacterium]TXN25143.1 tryptophan-rich sensory protein [Methylobacterium sp. WL9]GJE54666.1 Tryptophan-rich protein TspO [Methylobacterium thuringiense]